MAEAALRRRAFLRAFLAVLWVVCLYRAITQSVTHDEAFTYQLYIAAPFGEMFHHFDANHHFLNTLLMRLSVALFGVSEWSLRLPALAAAALYFAAVYQIGVYLIPSLAASLAAVALLTLNPFVLDFLVAARGYGMALALFTAALVILMRDSSPWRLTQAGVLLALAVTANLVFAVPVLVLAALVLVVRASAPNPAYGYFLAPLAVGGFLLFLAVPFGQASATNFYVGASSTAESLRSLAAVSLAYGGPLRSILVVNTAAFAIAPALVPGALAVGIRRRDALLVLAAGTCAGSAAVLLFAHALFGVPYPIERTGIYFLALAPLCLAGLIDCLGTSARTSVGATACGAGTPACRAETRLGAWPRISHMLLCSLSVALAVQFLLEFNTRSFLTWQYDADTRTIAERLARMAPRQQPDSVRVGASWQLVPSLNFYRDKQRLTWMRPVVRGSLVPGADLYAIVAEDRPFLDTLGLKPAYRGPLAGTILAVPAAAR